MKDDKPITVKERDWVDRVRPVFQPYHDAADEEDTFLDGERYEDDEDWHNRDRRLVQIRGKETEDSIQHDVAVWSLKPRNLQARPIDKKGDQFTGEIMASLVDHEMRRVDKDFDGELYKAVMAAEEHRYGLVWFDWHPDVGKWGEIFFGEEDFRNFLWDPSYSPHHPLNDRLFREKRIFVEEAREMYDAPWLEPDRLSRSRQGKADRILLRGGLGPKGIAYDDDKTTIWQFWHKNDKTKKYRDKQNGKDLALDPEDRYMSCSSGCGYRSPRQSESPEMLPEMMEQGCPTCGGDIERIDSLGEQEAIYAYAKGRRLVIMSPWQSPDDTPLFDGKWPVSRCRSYPGIFIPFKVRSGRLMGGSKVSWAWDQQIASDQLTTMGVQHVFSSQPLWEFPKVGLYDRDNRRFEKRDDQGNTMFRDDSQQFLRPNAVQRYDGGGLDSGWGLVLGQVQQKLQIGKADLGLTEESSKDIAASALSQITKQEELPISDFTKRVRRAVSQGAGVLSDMITATYPPARLTRLNIEGVDMILPVWGQDLPGFDFEIEDTPDFTGLEKSRVEALQMLEQLQEKYLTMGMPIEVVSEMVSLYAEEMHFPPSTVQKFQKVMAKIAEQQDIAEEEAAMMQEQQNKSMEDEAAQDLESGLDVPGLPPMNDGLNGSEMVSEPVA